MKKIQQIYFSKKINENIFTNRISKPYFEYLLSCANIKDAIKHNFVLYTHNNIYFKIFRDGSCFSFEKRNNKAHFSEHFIWENYAQHNLKNDDFPNKLSYDNKTIADGFNIKTKFGNLFFEQIQHKEHENYYVIYLQQNDEKIPNEYMATHAKLLEFILH
jgi:hypothetical protein